MDRDITIALQQLSRMRGMNALYHRQFFSDVRFTTVAVLALFVAGAAIDSWIFLAIPLVALLGAMSTAFDASYLIFSRQFATRLERFINDRTETSLLIAHELEESYLFPLDRTKIVTLRFGSDFTWFGFMTAFYTLLGVSAYLTGLALSLNVLSDSGRADIGFAYLATLATFTLGSLAAGAWWFIAGTGEERLKSVLDAHFGENPS
jgi:hypothetical protein